MKPSKKINYRDASFTDSIMLAPLSYFGLSADCGYLRITCSAKLTELKELMDRLERRLLKARLVKNQCLVNEILSEMNHSLMRHVQLRDQLNKTLASSESTNPTCYGLKQHNNTMLTLLNHLVENTMTTEFS